MRNLLDLFDIFDPAYDRLVHVGHALHGVCDLLEVQQPSPDDHETLRLWGLLTCLATAMHDALEACETVRDQLATLAKDQNTPGGGPKKGTPA